MGAPYTSTSVSNYNSNPPPDDGSRTEANRVKWATILSKIGNPLNSWASAINNAISTAFGKIPGGAGITTTAISYQVLSTDQGKLVKATASGITITTPDATDVGNPFLWRLLNDSDGDITLDGSGSQTIDGLDTITVPAGCGLVLDTDGANWFTEGQNYQRTQVFPQGYLTLVPEATDALNPIPSSDQSAKTTIYYRSIVGNLLPIPDGTNFTVKAFSEMPLALHSNHVADTLYDVFSFDDDDGTTRIGTGPAWNTSTAGSGARGDGAGTTELTLLKGLPVNKNAITVRNGATTYDLDEKSGLYLGFILIDGTNGQISCHVTAGQSRRWGISNEYNEQEIIVKVTDSASSWTPSSTRPANNSTANSAKVAIVGGKSRRCQIRYVQTCRAGFNNGAALNSAEIGNAIGFNATSTPSGKEGRNAILPSNIPTSYLHWNTVDMVAEYVTNPQIGAHTITALEKVVAAGYQPLFIGTEAGMLMTIEWRG